MEGYIQERYQSQILARQGEDMFSSHAIDSGIGPRPTLAHQSPSFGHMSSAPETTYASGRQVDADGPQGRAGICSAEPSVGTSLNTAGHNHWGFPRSSSTGVSTDQFNGSDDTTFFDDEFQAIHSSYLLAADHDSRIVTLGDQLPQQQFNDTEVDGRAHQMDTGDDQPLTESGTLSCGSTIVPPSYTPSQGDRYHRGNIPWPDVTYGDQATGTRPARSRSHDPEDPTLVQTFDTSSVLCSKAYATGGAVNQEIGCGPVMPQANNKSRFTNEQEACPEDNGTAEGYVGSFAFHSNGVQAAQLPALMEAVGQLSADADSTVPGSPGARPETSMESINGFPQPSEAQRCLKPMPRQASILEGLLSPTSPAYGSSSQSRAWLTPPSSKQSSPRFGTIDEITFPSQRSLFPTSPVTSPTVAHTLLSPPKTPTSGAPLDLFIYGNRPQSRPCAATLPSSSRTILPTGLIPIASTNKLLFSPSNVTSMPPNISSDNVSALPAIESIQCDHCQKSFRGNPATRSRSLKRHMETRHRGEAYECVYCNERVTRSDYRIRHLQSKKHRGQFPPTPKSRKRDPELDLFLQNSFRKIAIPKVKG